MKNDILDFTLGQSSTVAELANKVGKTYHVDGVFYKLVKASGSISPSKLIIQWDDATAGTVDAVGGAAETKGAIAGLGISGQVAVADGDYFYVIRHGRGTATSQTTSLAAGAAFATHGTAGKIDDGTVTYATALGYTNEAQSDADSDVEVFMELPL